MLSMSGASSFKLADAHKMLESACGSKSFAFPLIWAAIAGTMLSTTGASSFKLADAHKMLDRCWGIMSFALSGIWAAIAGTTSSALVSASDRCAMLQSTLAHACASNSSLATIPFTLWLSRSSKSFVLSPASSFPFLFQNASLWYEAEARKWLKIGPSKVRSKTFTNSSADFASFILTVNFFKSTFFPRFPSLPPPPPRMPTLPWNLLRPRWTTSWTLQWASHGYKEMSASVLKGDMARMDHRFQWLWFAYLVVGKNHKHIPTKWWV